MNGESVNTLPGVTAIVPTWNQRELLARALDSLSRQTHPIREVLVVDNGSEDGSAEAAERAGARVIRMGWNSGFSRAVNRGIQETTTEWVAVVNNDVELECEWLSRLLNAAAGETVWFATGKLLQEKMRDSIDGTYDTVCRGACAWRAGHARPDGAEFGESRPIRMAPFTAALFRSELFARVGLLDESFESHLEDVDFGLRCASGGYGGVYVPEAGGTHTGSATEGAWNPETVRRIARNQLLLVAKHYPKNWVVRYGWPVLVGQALWGFVAAAHGCGTAYLRGNWRRSAGFANTAGTLPETGGRIRSNLHEYSKRANKRFFGSSGARDSIFIGGCISH